MKNCIFCSIIHRDIPAQLIKETDELIVVKDIAPQAPTHLLIIPKAHIRDILSLADENRLIVTQMVSMAQSLAQELAIKDFRILINSGKFLHVPHLHMHFLGGAGTTAS